VGAASRELRLPEYNSVFIKLWLDVGHSALNHYFALWLIETDVFQLPQLHKHLIVSCDFMTTEHKFKYEVAFSFLQKDEQTAYQINDFIQDRIEIFIYSKKQEELVGTAGEKNFNNVFYRECRIVVLLYRNGWGATPWTRIEETAIRNRAFDSG
jgi:hypothetical protein